MCRDVEAVSVEPNAVNEPLRVVDDFDAFYQSEYRPLLKLAWSLTGRRDLGEELVQEVMVRCHERWGRISGYDRPGGFARRILLNEATSNARRRDAERRANERFATRPEPTATPLPDPAFWDALRELPQRQCQVVALHYVEDRSIAEIADVLDIAENTVKVHLHRGRQALADLLDDEEAER